jgi:hypothetical protein
VSCDKKRHGFYETDWRGYESLRFFADIYGITVPVLVEEYICKGLETEEGKLRTMKIKIENEIKGNRQCVSKGETGKNCTFATKDSDGDYVCMKYPSILLVSNGVPERCAACITENGVLGLAKELRAARKLEKAAERRLRQVELPNV